MIKLDDNKLMEQELFLLYDGVREEWKRILYFNARGHAVEVLLTPMDPRKKDNWREIERAIIRQHRTFGTYGAGISRQGDRMWRYVVRNSHSLVFREVQKAMLAKLPFEVVNKLLYQDLLCLIDWDEYAKNQRAGGCSLGLCARKSRS